MKGLRTVFTVERVTLAQGEYSRVELAERDEDELEDVPAFFVPDGALNLVDRDGKLRPGDEVVVTIRPIQEGEADHETD